MRNMSFMLTTEQMRDGSKTVTRRLGWKTLQPGALVRACVKCQGLKKGEKVEPIGVIEIVDVRRESLEFFDPAYHKLEVHHPSAEVRREGFPTLCPIEFLTMFCREMRCDPDTEVTRIEFRHRPDLTLCCGARRRTVWFLDEDREGQICDKCGTPQQAWA